MMSEFFVMLVIPLLLSGELNQLLDQKIIPGDVSLTFPSLGALEQHEQNFSMSVEKLKHKVKIMTCILGIPVKAHVFIKLEI